MLDACVIVPYVSTDGQRVVCRVVCVCVCVCVLCGAEILGES